MASQLNLSKIKIGTSLDSSKNFIVSTPDVANGTLSITRENGTPVVNIDATGVVSIPNNVVAFHVLSTTATMTDGGSITATYTTKVFDTTNSCNISTGVFQPSVAGYYQITGRTTVLGGGISRCFVSLIKNNGTAITIRGTDLAPYGPNGSEAMSTASNLFYLNGTSDNIRMSVYTDGTTITVGTSTVDLQGILISKA